LSDALGTVPSVMFSPADVELVAGSPAARRRFLDIMLALTSRGYLNALQQYRAALARRNAALRDATRRGHAIGANVAVWEPPLAEHGAALVAARRAWVDSVDERFGALCEAIGERVAVRLRYASTLGGDGSAAALAAALEEKRGLDARRGLTHVGPHRDDLVLTLDGRELKTFGSAGQQRTAAFALRMLEAATFREGSGRAPVFLLDDPFAELDARRSTRILELLASSGAGQTILVVPRETDIPSELTPLARMRVEGGVLSSWSIM
jgi:DNA replication and repair protein RecF